MLGIVLFIALLSTVYGYNTGAPVCGYPDSGMSSSQSGTGGFSLNVFSLGTTSTPSQIVGGTSYTVSISNSVNYAGFLVTAGTSISGNEGSFSFGNSGDNSDLQTGSNGCGGATHTINRVNSQRSSDQFSWTAPATLSSGTTVTFYGVGVITAANWYGELNHITSSTINFVAAPTSTAGATSSSAAASSSSAAASSSSAAASTASTESSSSAASTASSTESTESSDSHHGGSHSSGDSSSDSSSSAGASTGTGVSGGTSSGSGEGTGASSGNGVPTASTTGANNAVSTAVGYLFAIACVVLIFA